MLDVHFARIELEALRFVVADDVVAAFTNDGAVSFANDGAIALLDLLAFGPDLIEVTGRRLWIKRDIGDDGSRRTRCRRRAGSSDGRTRTYGGRNGCGTWTGGRCGRGRSRMEPAECRPREQDPDELVESCGRRARMCRRRCGSRTRMNWRNTRGGRRTRMCRGRRGGWPRMCGRGRCSRTRMCRRCCRSRTRMRGRHRGRRRMSWRRSSRGRMGRRCGGGRMGRGRRALLRWRGRRLLAGFVSLGLGAGGACASRTAGSTACARDACGAAATQQRQRQPELSMIGSCGLSPLKSCGLDQAPD